MGGFQYLQDSSQEMAECYLSSSWEGAETSLNMLHEYLIIIIWSPLTVFLCFCMISLLWLNLFSDKSRLKTWRGQGKDHRFLLDSQSEGMERYRGLVVQGGWGGVLNQPLVGMQILEASRFESWNGDHQSILTPDSSLVSATFQLHPSRWDGSPLHN